jgi:hypothetical protein
VSESESSLSVGISGREMESPFWYLGEALAAVVGLMDDLAAGWVGGRAGVLCCCDGPPWTMTLGC